MSCGVYSITNIKNKKVYIGQSGNVESRLYQHRTCLRGNYHNNEHLQRAFNKYGESAFEFDLVEECEERYLNSLEGYWCHMLNSHHRDYGYNIDIVDPNGKTRLSETTKTKISVIRKEQYKNPENNPFYGKKHSPESLEKMRVGNLGLKKRKWSKEERQKKSERLKDNHPCRKRVINIETGEIFNSINEACKSVGITPAIFRNYRNSKFTGNRKKSNKTKLKLL